MLITKQSPYLLGGGIIIFVLMLSGLISHTTIAQNKTGTDTKPPVKVLAPQPDPPLEPGECTMESDRGVPGTWLRQESNTLNKFNYWLGRQLLDINDPLESYFVGINSLPVSVLDVHYPANPKAIAGYGLSVTTGLCNKVGLVSGDLSPSWVGSYSSNQGLEAGLPFQVRAGHAIDGFWDPSQGTFIHLNPMTENIGIKTSSPQFPLDINGNFHGNGDGLIDQTVRAGTGATIGYPITSNPPANGMIVNGNVGIGTDNPGTDKVQIAESSNTAINPLLRLSNKYNGSGLKEIIINLDNNETPGTNTYQSWKLGAAVVDQNYFRILNSLGTRTPVATLEYFTIDGVTGNVGISRPSPSAKLHIAGESAIAGDLNLLSLSNRWNGNNTLKEPTISLDNGEPNPMGWKISAAVVNNDYFRIRKRDIDPTIGEQTHLQINRLGQTHLQSRIEQGTTNEVLRLSNIYSSTVPLVENEISIDNNAASPTGFRIGTGVAGSHFFRISSQLAGASTERFRIDNQGRVGIGTANPQNKMDIAAGQNEDALLRLSATTTQAKGIILSDGTTNSWRMAQEANSNDLVIGDGTTANSMAITPTGSFGIGTTNPHASSKLQILGNVWIQDQPGQTGVSLRIGNWHPNQVSNHQDANLICSGKGVFQSLFVLNPNEWNPWPDFVFAKNYKLPSLKETEQFIEKEQHLPGVPTAKEVNEKGVDLLEMNRILLQKVEEMTLHLIRLEKEVDALKAHK